MLIFKIFGNKISNLIKLNEFMKISFKFKIYIMKEIIFYTLI